MLCIAVLVEKNFLRNIIFLIKTKQERKGNVAMEGMRKFGGMYLDRKIKEWVIENKSSVLNW